MAGLPGARCVSELARCISPRLSSAIGGADQRVCTRHIATSCLVAVPSQSSVTHAWKDWTDIKVRKNKQPFSFPRDFMKLGQKHGPDSSVAVEKSYTLENGDVVVNRNPRSQELEGYKSRRRGFFTDNIMQHYFHKLTFHTSNKYAYAQLTSTNGRLITSCSTKEWAMERQLYSGCDKTACRNLGRRMAQNLLESGLVKVYWDQQDKKYHGKVKAFIDAIQESGISLKEGEQYKMKK